jgi:hypothetical protein
MTSEWHFPYDVRVKAQEACHARSTLPLSLGRGIGTRLFSRYCCRAFIEKRLCLFDCILFRGCHCLFRKWKSMSPAMRGSGSQLVTNMKL